MVRKAKRRAWTKAQVRTLKTLAKRKTKAASIARTLKRSEGATRQKALSMGLSLDSRARFSKSCWVSTSVTGINLSLARCGLFLLVSGNNAACGVRLE